ncbi:hypothetical protein [uncultured Cohaesibacter sp.]|uniref:hypothetical protein n=1 Tax=uncultured Cohaesibacter sp. TaxID=1002546 RepID=UPI0029C7861F|nr:hypothetical protein [uncultured Cohaesibacter sp.]
MFSRWRDRAFDRVEAKRRAIERLVPLRGRLDAILLSLFGLFAVGLVVLGVFLASGQARFGWFDPAPIMPFADDRLAANLRSDLARQSGPFVGAAYLAADDRLALLRKGGALHSVDLGRGLWSDDEGPDGLAGIESAFSDLSSGCSNQRGEARASCVDPRALFAYSEDGGLLVRHDDTWQVLVSDTRFVGASGNAIDHQDIADLAISADKHWLLLATRAEGLGLFDLTRRLWVPLSTESQTAIMGDDNLAPPSRMVAVGDGFLLATASGLRSVSFDARGEVSTARLVDGGFKTVLDLSVFEGEALVLATRSCGEAACLGLYHYDPSGSLVRLFGEDRLYPELSQARLSRALISQDGKSIFTLGDAGIYRYERAARSWEQLADEPLSVFLDAPTLNGLYFASAGQVGLLDRNGKISTWLLDGQAVRSLARDRDGRLLALTASNQTWRIGKDGVQLLTDGVAAREPLAEMKRAVSAFGRLVMVGKSHLVLHDVARRSYVSIPKAMLLPGLLFDADAQLFGGEHVLWALAKGEVEAWGFSGEGDAVSLTRMAHQLLSQPVRSVHRDGDALLMVDGSGRPFRLKAEGRHIAMQSLLGQIDRAQGGVKDVLHQGPLTYLARNRAVSVYSETERGYVDTIPMPINEDIREIAKVGDSLYLLGEAGSIIASDRNQRLTGSDIPFAFGSDALSDAMSDGLELFLASDQGVTVYSPSARGITRGFNLAVSGTLRLAGVADGQPVSYDGQGAWFGQRSLSVGGARVLSASKVGQDIATLQTDGEVTFLARHPIHDGSLGQPACYYRNPGPSGESIIDVVALPGLGVGALAGGTLWLRDQPHRGFAGFTLSLSAFPPNARLVILKDQLVIHNEQDAYLVPLAALQPSDSCDRYDVDLTHAVVHLAAEQLAVSEVNDEIGMLLADGAYQVWKDGAISERIPARAINGPDPKAFQSMARLGNGLYFADPSGIWRYESDRRHWSHGAFPMEAGAVVRSDLVASGDGLVMTVETADGRTLGGTVDAALSSLSLSPLRQWASPALPFSPDALADVARMADGRWLYLSDTAIAVAEEPGSVRPAMSRAIAMPYAVDGRKVMQQNGQTIIVDGDPDAPSSLLVIRGQGLFAGEDEVPALFSYQPAAGETVAVLADNRLLLHEADGAVRLCEWQSGQTGFSRCTLILPKALRLDARKISRAIPLEDSRWLVEMVDGRVWLVDRPHRQQLALSSDGGPIKAVLRRANGAILFERETGVLRLDAKTGALTAQGTAEDAESLEADTERFVGAIDAGSGMLDVTQLQDEQGQILISAGDFAVERVIGQMARIEASEAGNDAVRWDRQSGRFAFVDEAGMPFMLTAREAMPDGTFAFAAPGKTVALGDDHFMTVNRYGVWHYHTGLDQRLEWRRLLLPSTIAGAGQGKVYFADGRAIGAEDESPEAANPDYALSLGSLQLRANAMTGRVSASWSDGLKIHDAFADDGFKFDDRRDVAYADGEGWFLTPVGLVQADSLSDAAPLPSSRSVELTSLGNRLFALDGGRQWLVFDVLGWQRADNPFSDRQVAYDQDLIWLYQNGRLITRSTTRTMSAERRLGLRFESDILLDAAFAEDGLVVRLGDGVRQFSGFDALAMTVEASADLPAGLALAVRPMHDGRQAVVAVTRRGAVSRRWTGHGFDRVDYGDNPDIERIAAELDWLRVRFVANRPSIELKSEAIGVAGGWAPIGWDRGEPMPMDRFLTIHGVGGTLYAGSAIGLQMLTVDAGRIISQQFVELDGVGAEQGRHEPAYHIGAYRNRDAEAYVLGRDDCLAVEGGGLRPCERGETLSVEALGGNGFWQWERQKGEILLRYMDQSGLPSGEPVTVPASGQFPHDSLDDVVQCGGTLFQSWRGTVTALGGSMALEKSYPLGRRGAERSGLGALRFDCQPTAVAPSRLEPRGLPVGLYVSGGDALWRFDGSRFERAEAYRPALAMRQRGRMVFETNRMRVRNDAGGVQFDYRDGDSWRPLAMAGGRLAMDERQGLVSAKGQVWAYTRQGFVALDSGTGAIDPDQFSLTPLAGDEAAHCDFDLAETAGDGSSFLSLEEEADETGEGPRTVLRCLDGRLWEGRLDHSGTPFDIQLAPEATGDPFAERALFKGRDSAIELIGRTAGQPGSLRFLWRGEDNALSGGRFALDAVSQIAQIERDHVDMMTGLGWVRQQMGNWEGESAARAVGQQALAGKLIVLQTDMDVDRVLERDRPASASLCLEGENGDFYRWRPRGQLDRVPACEALLADDGHFAYRGGKDGVHMTAASLNGNRISRRLVEGRFSDLAVSGHAVLARLDGRIVVAARTDDRLTLFDPGSGALVGEWALTQKPLALTTDDSGAIALLSATGRQTLKGEAVNSCRALSGLAEAYGGDGVAGVEVASTRAYAHVARPGMGMSILSLQCEGVDANVYGDVTRLDDRTRYLGNFELWGRPDAAMALEAGQGNALWATFGGRRAMLMTLASNPLFIRRVGDHFIVADRDEVYQADLDALMSHVMRYGSLIGQGGQNDPNP